MKNLPTNLNSLESKAVKLNVDKLESVPVDLSKLSDVVTNNVVKKDVYNVKIKNIEDKVPDITNLATKTTLNPNLCGEQGVILPVSPFWFSLNNLETVKAVNMTF